MVVVLDLPTVGESPVDCQDQVAGLVVLVLVVVNTLVIHQLNFS
jgi:hypothetical protein